MSDAPKQVIVMRKDLNMRKGKLIAQGAHASVGAVLLLQEAAERDASSYGRDNMYSPEVLKAFDEWINGKFTKICVYVNSEAELDDIYQKAESAGLPVKLIVDSGLTEFHGVPTKTCLAIGPAWPADIDKITGNLPLL